MVESIHQIFLNNQFINTENTEHIAGLDKATTEVIRLLKLKKNKQLIIPYTLVALDPNISDDDPVVQEVQEIIIKKWRAFKNSVNKLNDAPITYIRAVILNALQKLSDDDTYAGIIWHASCNIISHYKITGQEEVLTNFIQEIGNKVEDIAQTEWGVIDDVQIEPIKNLAVIPSVTEQALINQENLQKHLMAAAAQLNIGGEKPKINKKTHNILLLSTSPKDDQPLRLDEEFREIEECIKLGDKESKFVIVKKRCCSL